MPYATFRYSCQTERKCVSVAAALRAEQGLYKQNFRAIVSQSEPESGKESQWKPECELQNTIRSQLVPEKDQLGPIRARESTREPERELESKPVSWREQDQIESDSKLERAWAG